MIVRARPSSSSTRQLTRRFLSPADIFQKLQRLLIYLGYVHLLFIYANPFSSADRLYRQVYRL